MKTIYLSLFVTSAALAGGSPPHDDNASGQQQQEQSQQQGQAQGQGQAQLALAGSEANAGASSVGVNTNANHNSNTAFGGAGGDAASLSNAVSANHNSNTAQGGEATGGDATAYTSSNSGSVSQGGDSQQSQSANNDGNSLSTSYKSDFKSLALGLGSVAAAPIDTSVCRMGQTAGWRVALVERSGRNKLDATCVREQIAFGRCMDIARAYLTAGMKQSYAAQLAVCGGKGVEEPAPVAAAPVDYATKEYVRRVFEATQRK